jgi:hypothetical protein
LRQKLRRRYGLWLLSRNCFGSGRNLGTSACGTGLAQVLDDAILGREDLGGRRLATRCLRTTSTPDQLDYLVALFRIEAAQLVLDIETVPLAQFEQVLALHVERLRQCVDSDLLLCQAVHLPVVRSSLSTLIMAR